MGGKNMKEKIALIIFSFSVLIILSLGFLFFQGNITGKVIENSGQESPEKIGARCADSDNGKNYGLKGIVSYCDEDNNCDNEEDFCSGKKLTEYFCENSQSQLEAHDCENDCDNGACFILAKDYNTIVTGSGGGSVSVPQQTEVPIVRGQNYNLEYFDSEKSVGVAVDDKVLFILNGNQYSLAVREVTPAQISISINALDFILLPGKEERYDLTGDGNNDIYIKVRSIDTISQRVNLVLNTL
ncbi:MAG: hypothetical protein ABH840_02630 [Nanoarchaeota archaeon]